MSLLLQAYKIWLIIKDKFYMCMQMLKQTIQMLSKTSRECLMQRRTLTWTDCASLYAKKKEKGRKGGKIIPKSMLTTKTVLTTPAIMFIDNLYIILNC